MGSSDSVCLMMFQIRHWPEIQKFGGSTGTKGSTSNFTHMVVGSPQFLTGCLPHHFAAHLLQGSPQAQSAMTRSQVTGPHSYLHAF